mgnify:CR=1 FL=1|jgi:hypothetical protein
MDNLHIEDLATAVMNVTNEQGKPSFLGQFYETQKNLLRKVLNKPKLKNEISYAPSYRSYSLRTSVDEKGYLIENIDVYRKLEVYDLEKTKAVLGVHLTPPFVAEIMHNRGVDLVSSKLHMSIEPDVTPEELEKKIKNVFYDVTNEVGERTETYIKRKVDDLMALTEPDKIDNKK